MLSNGSVLTQSAMRILVIGGNGFIGSPLVRELRDSGHQVAVFHRRHDAGLGDVEQIEGDRNRFVEYRNELSRFAPEVIVDLILSSGDQARELMGTVRDVAARVVAISSMDVYRAWGVLHGVEPGPLEPLPLREDSPLRTTRQLYPAETVQMMQRVFSWLDDRYDKIAAEETIRGDPQVQWTVLRLPMVYGPSTRASDHRGKRFEARREHHREHDHDESERVCGAATLPDEVHERDVAERAAQSPDESAREAHEGAENGRVMCLSLHPHNIGRPNAAKHLDAALRYILGPDGVWNTTADDIAEYYIANYYDTVFAWIADRRARK